jgi:hypothetical protein
MPRASMARSTASPTSALLSFVCTSLILASIGISYLVKLDYQSTHQAVLIDAWSVYGSKNTYYVMEKFQYGNKNDTCLIKRRTGRAKKQSKKVAKKKKLGSTRKVWLYKDGHCSDSALRQFYLQSGIGYLAPFGLAIFCLFGFLFYSVVDALSSWTTSPEQQRTSVPQTNPPKDSHVSSTEIEMEMPQGGL